MRSGANHVLGKIYVNQFGVVCIDAVNILAFFALHLSTLCLPDIITNYEIFPLCIGVMEAW